MLIDIEINYAPYKHHRTIRTEPCRMIMSDIKSIITMTQES